MKKSLYIILILTTVLCVGCSKGSSETDSTPNTNGNTSSKESTSKENTSNVENTSDEAEETTSNATATSNDSSDILDSSEKATDSTDSSKSTTDKDSTTEQSNPTQNQDSNLTQSEDGESLFVKDQVVIDGMTEDILNNMSIEEKIGQLFIVSFESLDSSNGNYYEWREVSQKMKTALDKYHVGGVQFFSRNIETREQTSKMITDLQDNSRVPLFIAVDEEGGDASPLGNNSNMGVSQFPSMEIVGDINEKDYSNQIGETIGEQIRELGFNLDFAPVSDVEKTDKNVTLGNRSFGSDTDKVSDMVSELVEGLQSQYVAATLKYFPGEGDSSKDTKNGAVNIDINLETLRDIDFTPFKAGIKAGADVIMVSHASISRVTENIVPSSLSSLVMQNILRTELGFEGVVMTDALNKKAITDSYSSGEAAVKAVKAGADVLLMPENLKSAYNSILNAVENGTIKESRIDKSVRRILKLKLKRGIILSDTNLIEKEIEQ